MKRVLLYVCICGALLGGLFFVFSRVVYKTAPQQDDASPITLVFVGDIMLDRGVKRKVINTMKGDYNALFADTSYLAQADIAFANLEGPVAYGGRNVGSKFSFRMDPVVLSAIKNAGIDVVSFANNHVGDYTKEAFDETLQRLYDTQIVATGAGKDYQEASTPDIITVRGVRVGYLAVTDVGPNWLAASEKSSGILLASDPALPEIIASADTLVDVLVISFHWGDEYSPFNKRQVLLAHSAVDYGADVVVGHHPHVIQATEVYKEKQIFYSLGNFIFDQYFSPHTLQGMVATVSVDPITKKLTAVTAVSPMSRDFVPKTLVPFTDKDLVLKTFIP